MNHWVYFLVLAASVTLSCKQTPEKTDSIDTSVINNPKTADGNKKDGLPVFQFETEEHNFGNVFGEKVSFGFKFKNVGEGPLVISGAESTCGCTVPEYPKNPIQPGEQGVIMVAFDSDGKQGFQTKHVTLLANTTPNSKVLTIRANCVSQNN
ncbi:MAG: DUF1573 domain-containing protein [Bacteroidetes bacterium]|nr:DUF1573 domain-containing protein [Bacteroidota bacterium]MBU1720050.1 DUF1573 domain-containing protein [Bacteroidota bacterium]